ncbi:cell division protein ZapA [Sphingomonas hankookensis]|uniref:cell division protein ZapA n=1 Tax=Sphingomonas hankookensis TaxID=563996 RepID=UPI003D302D65
MGQITLSIAGRSHQVGCRDGEEPKLRALGAVLERHAAAAQRASGGSSERTLLYIALILADQLAEETVDAPPIHRPACWSGSPSGWKPSHRPLRRAARTPR